MKQPEIKAIPTVYNKVEFRSRLEARVAVFLDAMGAEWHYEHQGFDLDGRWYLPDFWLPKTWFRNRTQGVWLEVKPTSEHIREAGNLVSKLAEMTGKPAFLFYGNIRSLDWFAVGDEGNGMNQYCPEQDGIWFDDFMGFQSDGHKTVVEFYEGSYQWGKQMVTSNAVTKALSAKF